MSIINESSCDSETVFKALSDDGYLVLEGLLHHSELKELRSVVDQLLVRERQTPFDPGDGPESLDDQEIEAFFAKSYTVSQAELGRLMRRIRQTRALNHGTPWPVPPDQVSKLFLHMPTMFDQDQSQRIWNLRAKSQLCARLVEEPRLLKMVRSVLGPDCILSDMSVNCIGPQTEGGAWHVDVPLGQMPEPLPDFPLTLQNVWMLDEFTAENGATRVVPRSHLRRRKPAWGSQQEDEVILTGPAGSVAIWLSNTWHRSGPNITDRPRHAILGYYCRSWVKPFSDYRFTIPEEMVEGFSPTLRYLLGFSANCPSVRG